LKVSSLLGPGALPFAVDQFLPGASAGVALHGVMAPAQVPGDRSDAVALGEQFVHQRVVTSGAFGEPSDGSGLVRRRLRRARLWLAWCWVDRTQAGAVAGHAPLDRLAEVLPQVEPVGDLHRARRAQPSALGVGAGAVPADHLHPGMGPQPVRQRLCLPACQQLHRLAALAVDQHRAVDLATP
jgi:hypothetical protein